MPDVTDAHRRVKPSLAPVVRDGVRLRLLEEADLPLTLAWRNRDDVRQWFFSSAVIDLDQHRAWYHRYRDNANDLVFIVEETERLHRAVGQVSLYRIDEVERSAEFGRLMIGDPAARGCGLGLAATQLALEIAAGPLGLRRVRLETTTSNRRALEIYRACGFVETGRDREVVTMILECRAA